MSQPNMGEVEAASLAFDQLVMERHLLGAEKYGPVRFMEIDSIQMALEEIADLANYARYTFIKLYLLRSQISGITPATLGPGAVINPHKGE